MDISAEMNLVSDAYKHRTQTQHTYTVRKHSTHTQHTNTAKKAHKATYTSALAWRGHDIDPVSRLLYKYLKKEKNFVRKGNPCGWSRGILV